MLHSPRWNLEHPLLSAPHLDAAHPTAAGMRGETAGRAFRSNEVEHLATCALVSFRRRWAMLFEQGWLRAARMTSKEGREEEAARSLLSKLTGQLDALEEVSQELREVSFTMTLTAPPLPLLLSSSPPVLFSSCFSLHPSFLLLLLLSSLLHFPDRLPPARTRCLASPHGCCS